MFTTGRQVGLFPYSKPLSIGGVTFPAVSSSEMWQMKSQVSSSKTLSHATAEYFFFQLGYSSCFLNLFLNCIYKVVSHLPANMT